VKQESILSVITQNEKISGPPKYLTTDWEAAEKSVRNLKDLNPTLIIPSHGQPMEGEELSKHLQILVDDFDKIAVPRQGRFVE
jgi:glyoxylase-like metal-dependent hydrolase (beta-lactamase superfamily II)